MKRRAFIQTVTGVVSAVVFTGTGWLMGTRTLTMGGAQMPPPDPPPACGHFCAAARDCVQTPCQPAQNGSTFDYYFYSSDPACPTSECLIERQRGICDCVP